MNPLRRLHVLALLRSEIKHLTDFDGHRFDIKETCALGANYWRQQNARRRTPCGELARRSCAEYRCGNVNVPLVQARRSLRSPSVIAAFLLVRTPSPLFAPPLSYQWPQTNLQPPTPSPIHVVFPCSVTLRVLCCSLLVPSPRSASRQRLKRRAEGGDSSGLLCCIRVSSTASAGRQPLCDGGGGGFQSSSSVQQEPTNNVQITFFILCISVIISLLQFLAFLH